MRTRARRPTTTCGPSWSPATVVRSAPAPTSRVSPRTDACRTTAATSRTSGSGTRPKRPRHRSGRWRSRSSSGSTGSVAARAWTSSPPVTSPSRRIGREFFDPHVSIGLASGREMVRVARAVPVNVAMRMAIMGKQERMSAQRAFDVGLITEVVEHEALGDRLRELAAMVNRNAPLAVRGTRLAIRKGLGLPLYEAELLAEAFRERVLHTDDSHEGPARVPRETRPRVEVRVSGAAYETIRYEVDAADRVATITLDRPDALNAFNRQMCEEIRDVWHVVKDDDTVQRGRAARRRRTRLLRRPRHQAGLRAARSGVEPRRPGRVHQPEVAEGLEAGRVRGARDVHRGCVLLPQRGRRRDLLRRRDVLRLAREPRLRLRDRADRADAAHRARRDAAHRAHRQRRACRRETALRLGLVSEVVSRADSGRVPTNWLA